ncbi:hypothetical protein FGG08_000453 [Glutinoglossum americanum]|uniref:C2H2-type domain-containing protein n=1 Tax=Glutinoglossum americanum TaxID=1670608 RepID=A0A9P8IGE1_9PEZI|nr:hypothetical protein FGG08_000453 [Glutinoglossum americanum]
MENTISLPTCIPPYERNQASQLSTDHDLQSLPGSTQPLYPAHPCLTGIWGECPIDHRTAFASQTELEPPYPGPAQGPPPSDFPDLLGDGQPYTGYEPFSQGNNDYADEDFILLGLGYDSAAQEPTQLLNSDIEVQAGSKEGLKFQFGLGPSNSQAMHTQSGVIGSESAPAGNPLSQISPSQAAFVPQGYHGRRTGHMPYRCQFKECKSTFSRADVMKRHQGQHYDNAPRYSCHYCQRHTGINGFKRKDHLQQHIRNYHHKEPPVTRTPERSYLACIKAGCTEYRERQRVWYRDPDMPFSRESERTEHMRKVHNESPFPCDTAGCDRVDGKGFFRESDLQKHKKKTHGDDAE